ncbi:MAG: tetratricopeptide repeat-containing glycosyltransferase family protein [Bdellovibrionales bacterium]
MISALLSDSSSHPMPDASAEFDLMPLALQAHAANHFVEAEKLYRAIFAANPHDAKALYHLGLLFAQQDRVPEAFAAFGQVTQMRPDLGPAWFMLSEFADRMGERELQLIAGEQAVKRMPHTARAWLRHGIALARVERHEEACASFRRAVSLDSSLVAAWANLCVSSKALGRFREAEDSIRRALSAAGATAGLAEQDENSYSFLHWHLALLELLRNDYRAGFAHFRARFVGGTDWIRHKFSQPLWRGEDLRGKTLLVTTEQGHGDAIMLARYLPLLKARGARVLFQAHPALARLFEGWSGADKIIPLGQAPDEGFDYHTAIFDLPYRFGTSFEMVPASMPYISHLSPDSATRLQPNGSPAVGVIWAGHPGNLRGLNRSVPLADFAPLFGVSGFRFFNLTRDMREGEADLLPRYPMTDLSGRLSDFADTARFMQQMDLIITCDTATAHLAGALGKPVWTLLPFVADWRWGAQGDSCPWYPTMRLFRQEVAGDWGAVVQAARHGLLASGGKLGECFVS